MSIVKKRKNNYGQIIFLDDSTFDESILTLNHSTQEKPIKKGRPQSRKVQSKYGTVRTQQEEDLITNEMKVIELATSENNINKQIDIDISWSQKQKNYFADIYEYMESQMNKANFKLRETFFIDNRENIIGDSDYFVMYLCYHFSNELASINEEESYRWIRFNQALKGIQKDIYSFFQEKKTIIKQDQLEQALLDYAISIINNIQYFKQQTPVDTFIL